MLGSGLGGRVVRTTDGGSHWTVQTSGTTSNLSALAFADALHGWLVGDDGTIRHTADGGKTWGKQTSGTTQDLKGVACVSVSQAWAVGSSGVMLRTTDAGKTWARRVCDKDVDLNQVVFTDALHGWASGSHLTAFKTIDGGKTWRTLVADGGGFLGISAVNSDSVWATGNDGSIVMTASGAAPLTPVTSALGVALTTSTGWSRGAHTVTLSVAPGIDPATPAGIYYTIDGGVAVTYTGSFVVSGGGNHIVQYWSADVEDRLERANTGYVNIDDLRPICEALKAVTVRRGQKATLPFVIDDDQPSCGYANVTILITRNGKVVKTLTKAKVPVNTTRSKSFTAWLPRGSYRWTVSAKDVVGNPQSKTASRSLYVK